MITVKNFGATGNGETDDTQSIEDTLTYMKANGLKKLIFPPGTYKTRSIVIDFDGVIIEGAGMDLTIIKSSATTDAFSFKRNGEVMKNISIKDMTIMGETARVDSSGVRFFGIDGLTINRVKFQKFGLCGLTSVGYIFRNVRISDCQFIETVESGISVRPCKNIIVDRCIFEKIIGNRYPGHGVYFRTEVIEDSKNLFIRNCIFRETPSSVKGNAYAIKVVHDNPTIEQSMSDVVIEGNIIGNYFGGIWVIGAKRVFIHSNRIESVVNLQTSIGGIALLDSEDVNISDNIINSLNLCRGISLSGATKKVIITGNKIETSRMQSLFLDSVTDLTVSNNVIKQTLSTDEAVPVVDLRGISSDIKIKNNTFKISQKGIQTSGTSTITGIVINGNSINPIEGTTPTKSINLVGNVTKAIVINNDLVGSGTMSIGSATQAGNITS
jgi:polygalacturonase